MTKILAFEVPGVGVSIIRPMYNDTVTGCSDDEAEDVYLRRVLARNIETAMQKTRHGTLVNEHLNVRTAVYVVDASEVPPVGHDISNWRIPEGSQRISLSSD